MTGLVPTLLAALVAACLAIAVEGYVLIGRQTRQADLVDQLLEAARLLLARVPSTTSAPRTEAPADVTPRRWYGHLSRTAPRGEAEPVTQPADRVLIDEWAATVNHDDAPTDRIPAVRGRHAVRDDR